MEDMKTNSSNMRPVNNIDDLPVIQRIEKRILDAIVDFCDRNSLTYYMAHGTLIGVVRHSGFIPWDDDIDLLMPRPDFDKLVSLCKEINGLVSGRYRLGFLNTEPEYNRIVAKIYDTSTMLEETDRRNTFGEGLFVDIWPLDGVPNNRIIRKLYLNRLQLLNSLLASSIIYEYNGTSKWKRFIYKVIMPISRKCVKPYKLAEHITNICRKQKYARSEFVVNSAGPKKCFYRREWFDKSDITHLFELKSYRIPADSDSVLRQQYGEYMQLPPADKQKPHHKFTAYIQADDDCK